MGDVDLPLAADGRAGVYKDSGLLALPAPGKVSLVTQKGDLVGHTVPRE